MIADLDKAIVGRVLAKDVEAGGRSGSAAMSFRRRIRKRSTRPASRRYRYVLP
jgi:hypothetical protein